MEVRRRSRAKSVDLRLISAAGRERERERRDGPKEVCRKQLSSLTKSKATKPPEREIYFLTVRLHFSH